MTSVFQDDFTHINECSFIPWEKLSGQRVLVTGATGLIGKNLVMALMFVERMRKLGLSIVVLVRNIEKAVALFGNDPLLTYAQGDIADYPENIGPIDYIVHCACPTASRFFIENPVETIELVVNGTQRILHLGLENKVKGFVFLSSMEVYGFPHKGEKVDESYIGSFHPSISRNSYPLSKIICENLCCSYASEYNLPTRVLRLTQTFGPGVDYSDNRIFAEFGRCIKLKKDICLRTKGETERSYLYTADAVTAILATMLNGGNGQIYNVANESTYCSILQMAKVAAVLGGIKVKILEQDFSRLGYADTLFMDLDTKKIQGLGWMANTGLREMFVRMMEAM